jgi:5'(3')-deoxyribonucleotidase
MIRPRVLLDVDGVLCDFIGGVLELVEEYTGQRRTREEVDRFDFAAALGLSPDIRRKVYTAIAERAWWWRLLRPHDGSRAGVDALQEIADVWIVTSPWDSCPRWLYERTNWLRSYFDIPASRVITTHAKHLVDGDWIVDDKTATLEACARACLQRLAARPIQWATPHNRNDGWMGREARSWSELLAIIAPVEREVLR